MLWKFPLAAVAANGYAIIKFSFLYISFIKS